MRTPGALKDGYRKKSIMQRCVGTKKCWETTATFGTVAWNKS